MGDATNLVLILAGELLKRSEHLLTMGLHPSDVIQGYEMALEKGREELQCGFIPVIQARNCYMGNPADVSQHWSHLRFRPRPFLPFPT